MAKRKRLTLPNETLTPELETKSAFPPMSKMPIAEVAGETAARAALEEVAGAMAAAEQEGRVVKKVDLSLIDTQHLNRDRMVIDAEEFAALKASIEDRGQQTPIEVVQISGGRFGLISGLRRVLALKELGVGEALALIKRPETAEAAYVAMIEENEVRSDLSFYERANIAVQAVTAGVYPNASRAVKGLFARSPSAKRSKILKFVIIRETLGKSLKFPTAIPEKLGLALASAIEADRSAAKRISEALRRSELVDAAAERKALERALKPAGGAGGLAPGVTLKATKGKAVLSGAGVDASFLADLKGWLANR